MFRIFFTPAAERAYKKLPLEIRERIKIILSGKFAEYPFAPEFRVHKLKPPFPGYRIRFGDYRMMFEVGPNSIRIYKIKNRKNAYR